MDKDTVNKVILKYLGTGYKFNGESIKDGLDCINLCCLVSKDLGGYIPNINHLAFNQESYSVLFKTRHNDALWQEVEPEAGTLAVFTINGVVKHVGYMLNSAEFIHILEGSKVTVDSIYSFQWGKRLVGCYKYIGPVV